MRQTTLSNGKTVSALGIGGHYKHFEYGRYEETYGPVEESEVTSRTRLVEQAVDNGVTYFDSTWYNEAEMLGKTLARAGVRNKVHVNGMVLGAFPGSVAFGMSEREYFSKYLDKRLAVMPGNYFDSFMINAIEEHYNRDKCAELVDLLLRRKQSGDIGMIGFSCHNHPLAREIADEFPEFEIIMTAYNFRNHWFEKSFEGYNGNASFVAMKPMVWAQYGIPFNTINRIADFEQKFGFVPVDDIAVKALRYPGMHPRLNVTLASVNTEDELKQFLAAGRGENTPDDLEILAKYDNVINMDKGAPLFIGGLELGNTRTAFFCADNLCNLLGIDKTGLTVKNDNREQVLEEFKKKIYSELKNSPLNKYL